MPENTLHEKDVQRIIDNANISLELKIVEKLGVQDKVTKDRISALERKVNFLQQSAFLIGAIAVIFGVSGAWGYKVLRGAQSQLASMERDVSGAQKEVIKLSGQVNSWSKIKEEISSEIAEISRDTVRETISKLDTERRAAISELHKGAKSIVGNVLRSGDIDVIKTRSLIVRGKDGEKYINLFTGENGGKMIFFEKSAGKAIISIGSSSNSGNGGLWVYNRNGGERVRIIGTDVGGVIRAYNNEYERSVVSLGVGESGDSFLSLRNKQGKKTSNISSSGQGGVIRNYNTGNGNRITSIGSSTDGNGGVWIYDRLGAQTFRK